MASAPWPVAKLLLLGPEHSGVFVHFQWKCICHRLNPITEWRAEILPGCPGTVVAFVAGIEGLAGCSQDYQGCTDVAEVWFAGLGHGFIAELCPLMFFP